ncbi:hypothetical protein R1flu_026972 [Riccia fluitans]|uniref:Uncharacterized protein n=1 Tax=Riccia fluitans TaxID=41844 RepID=A0ABD1XI21_9MARC
MGKSAVCGLRFLLVLGILTQGSNVHFVSAQSFPALVCIGASQSDVGVNNNVQGSVARANFLPYGRDFINGNRRGPTGRFSNGKILPDLLAENFGLPFPLPYNNPTATGAAIVQGINTASAGSGWLNGTSSALGVIPGTQQVQWVKKWQQNLVAQVGASRASTIVQESPYLINISDNDILAYFQSTELQQQYTEEQYRKLIIDTAVSNIKDLYSGGARKFAVTSVSARGCSPGQITRYQPTKRDQCVGKIQTFVQKYNTEYKGATQSLQSTLPGSKFFFADTFSITVDLFLNPSKYGFRENTSRACCGTGTFETGPLCNSLSIGTCLNATNYLFFDSEHYSQNAWRIIVGTFIEDLKSSLLTQSP